MESNKQTELTSKIERLIDGGQMTAVGEQGGEGVEEWSKKEKELMDMDNSVVIAEGRGI